MNKYGKVAERSKAHAWKACTYENMSGVRIPPFPHIISSVT